MLKIGWSKKDVSTNKPVIIPGQYFIRISEGVLDPITLTALTIDDGNDSVIFVEVDAVGMEAGVLTEIQKRVKARNSDINTSKILINITHTHSGTRLTLNNDTASWGKYEEFPHDGVEITSPDEYMEFFLKSACDAICESFENREEGYISYGYGYAVVAHSRRTVYNRDMTADSTDRKFKIVEGSAKMYGKTNTPDFSHFEAGADHYANFMFTFDQNEKLTGAIVNIPCPSQNMEMENLLSSDYWHDVRTELTKRYGDIYILPQCAAAGDLSPRTLYYRKAEDRRYRMKYSDLKIDDRIREKREVYNRTEAALQICASFDEVYAWASKEKYNDMPIVHTVKTLQLDRRLITDEEYDIFSSGKETEIEFTPTGDKLKDVVTYSEKLAFKNSALSFVARYQEQKDKPYFETDIHIIKIGDIAFASNQFELYMDYQHRIQARSPFTQTFIVQLCAQHKQRTGTYLPTERAFAARGYSANIYTNAVTPNGGNKLVEETLTELNKLYAEK